MGEPGISDINDYNSLYKAYGRLREEGDKTNSAKNAETVFGQKVDLDGDGVAELWELMQRANEAHNRIIFDEIGPLKQMENIKAPNISEDNPIRVILAIESETCDRETTKKAVTFIDKVIEKAKKDIPVDQHIFKKLEKLYSILEDGFKVSHSDYDQTLLSDAFKTKTIILDCDTGSFVYLAVAHEFKWQLHLATGTAGDTNGHAFVFWQKINNVYGAFETTNGGRVNGMSGNLIIQNGQFFIKNDKNYLYCVAYRNRAIKYQHINDYEKSLRDSTKAIDLLPTLEDTYITRGNAYRGLNMPQLAIMDFTTAIKLDPNDEVAYYNRGCVYGQLGQNEPAIADYSQAIRIYPGCSQAYNNRGAIYCEQEVYEKALADVTKALELDKKYVDAYCNRGKIYIAMNKGTAAIDDYNAAISLEADHAAAYNGLAIIFATAGQHKRAVELYDKAISLGKKDENLYCYYSNRGRSHIMLNEIDQGINDLSKAIGLKPDYAEEYRIRGRIYEALHENEKAEKDLKVFQELTSKGASNSDN